MNKFRIAPLLKLALLICMFGLPSAYALDYADIEAELKLITVDNPMDPKYANAGDNLRNGVGSIFVQFLESGESGFLCTAAAISPRHILTAAHCVTEEGWTVSSVEFILSAGLQEPMFIEATGFAVHPWYPATAPIFGAFAHGDIAVIELEAPLPAEIEIYELYRDFDEFGQQARHYGHGVSGKGNKGAIARSSFFYGRTGLNTYEQVLEPFLGTGVEDQLLSDFDSGGRKHNAMAWWFSTRWFCAPEQEQNPPHAQDGQCTTLKDGGYPDFKGFGKFEIGIAPGDSGGPAFIDDKIAGVHSFGLTHFCAGNTNGTDFSCGLNSSYGELSGDTRVSYHAGFVDAVVSGSEPITPIGVPAVARENESAAAEFLSPAGKSFIEGVFSATMRGIVE